MDIGIIGCGAIGSTLAKAAEAIPEIKTIYVFDKSHICSRVMEEKLTKVCSILEFDELLERSDFIIEAASQEAVVLFAKKVLEGKKDILILSVGALVDDELRESLQKTALAHSSRVYIPTGALCGVDAVCAGAVAGLNSVTLITRKPPSAFADVDYLTKKGIGIEDIKTPMVLFEGTARDAVKLFPKNVNVAATVSMAGIGFDRTMVKIVADPSTTQNHHTIVAEGSFGTMRAEMNTYPFERNPKTSKIAAQSAISALKKIFSQIWTGV